MVSSSYFASLTTLMFLTSHSDALHIFSVNENNQTLKCVFLIVNQCQPAERETIRILIVDFRKCEIPLIVAESHMNVQLWGTC